MKKTSGNRASIRSKELWRSRIAVVSDEHNKHILTEFFETVQARKRGKPLGPRTKNSYSCILANFVEWLNAPLEAVKDTDLDNFIGELEKSNRKPNTISNYKIVLRTFYRWMGRRHKVEGNPAAKLEIAMDKKTPFYLSPNEVQAMFTAAKDIGPRESTIIRTLFATGLRASELVNLSLDPQPDRNYIDFERGIMSVNITKSKKAHSFKIPDWQALKPILEDYIQNHRIEPDPKKAPNNPLFTGRNRQGLHYTRLYEIFKEAAAVAGLNRLEFFPERTYEDITPHIARKSFATAFIRSGGDIIRLKGILGHENINTTMIYLGMVRAELDDSDTEMGLYEAKTDKAEPQIHIPAQTPTCPPNEEPTPILKAKNPFDMAYI